MFQSYLTKFIDLLRFCSKAYSTCLVPRPLYSARPMRFSSCDPNEFVSLSSLCSSRLRLRDALAENAQGDGQTPYEGRLVREDDKSFIYDKTDDSCEYSG